MKKITRKFTLLIAALLMMSHAAIADDNVDLKKRLDEMEKRLNELEAQNSLQNVIWSGTLINRYEHFRNNYMTGIDNLDGYSTALAINGDFTVNEKTKVYTTIAMAKFWNLTNRLESWGEWKQSEEGSYAMSGAIPSVDRAYLSYKFDIPLTFSIGRMPTNNGLPINQLDGLARQGTYPHLAYNAIFDGIAFTYDFKQLPSEHTLALSAFYTPWVNVNPVDRTRAWVDTNNNNYVTGTSPQYSILLDYAYTGTSWFKKLNFEYMWYRYLDFYWWGDNNSPKTAAGANGTFAGGPNLYDGTNNMIYVGVDDIADTGISFSASGQYYGTHYIDATTSPYNTFAASYLFTLNKTFGNDRRTILGAEYINTDKYYYLDESAALEMIPFYSQPNSKGYHIYATRRLTNSMALRVGYYRLQTMEYDPALITPADYTSYYANLRVDF